MGDEGWTWGSWVGASSSGGAAAAGEAAAVAAAGGQGGWREEPWEQGGWREEPWETAVAAAPGEAAAAAADREVYDLAYFRAWRLFHGGYRQHKVAMKFFRDEREDPIVPVESAPVLFSSSEPAAVAAVIWGKAHAPRMNVDVKELSQRSTLLAAVVLVAMMKPANAAAKIEEDVTDHSFVFIVMTTMLMIGMWVGWKVHSMMKPKPKTVHKKEGPDEADSMMKAKPKTADKKVGPDEAESHLCGRTTQKEWHPDGSLICVSDFGECYHMNRLCYGLRTAARVTRRRPCKLCALDKVRAQG